MNKHFIIILTLLVALCSFMTSSYGEASSRVYAGGGLGLTNAGWVGEDTTGIGFDGKAGYQFNRTWSVEGGFTHFADTTGTGISSISTNALSIIGKASLPIGTSKFRVYSGFGLGNVFNSGGSTASHLGYVMAYGLELPLNNNLTLTGGYTFFQGHYSTTLKDDVPNATYYNLNLTYLLPESLFQ